MKSILRPVSTFALAGLLAACGGSLSITPTSLPNAVEKVPYTGTKLSSPDGKPPVTFKVASGTLPVGISLSTSGDWSGTPTVPGKSDFTVKGEDDASGSNDTGTASYSINVLPQLKLDTTLPAVREGRSYSAAPKATGGVSPYVWKIEGLPGGLSADTGTGVVSGTIPTSVPPKTLTVQITVVDSGDPKQTVVQLGSLQVLPPSVSITTTTLPSGKVGQPYGPIISGSTHGVQLAAANGSGSFQWSISDGLLPDGLRLDPSSGVISGTPTAPTAADGGAISLEITVSDTVSTGDSDKHTFTLSVLP